MNTPKMKLLFYINLAIFFAAPLNAQECQENFNKGEICRQKGQYEKAIGYYTKSQNCGDVNYRAKSKAMISDVNRLIREGNAVKNTPNSKRTEYIIVPSLIYLPNGTDEQTVTVESSGDWRIRGKSNIINVAKKNSKTLTVSSVSENTSTKPRRSSVTVECGEVTRTITIEQDGVSEVLEYKSKYMNVPYTGGRFVVELNTNTKWKVDYADWYKVAQDENDSTRMVIIVDNNTKNEDRNGTIIVRSEEGTAYDEMEIHQYANESRIFSPVDSIIHFAAKRDTIYVPIISDNPKWTESDRPSWCLSKKVNDSTLMVSVVANDNYVSREGFVNIKSNDRVSGIWIIQDASEKPDIFTKNVLGGRPLSFGITAGYLFPMISASSGGTFTGSPVNYALGNNNEEVSYSSGSGFAIGAHADTRLYKNFYLIAGINYLHYSYKNEFQSDVNRVIPQTSKYALVGNTQNKYSEEYTLNTLEIPILASYRLPINKKSHMQFNLGPVINYGLSAKMKLSGNTGSETMNAYKIVGHQVTNERYDVYNHPMHYTGNGELDLYGKNVSFYETHSEGNNADFNKDNTFEASPFKRIQFGARIGVTYEYSGISLGLEYNYMLTNLANKKFWEGDRWTVFDQTANTIMSGYKQRNNYLSVKLGYTFRY